MPRFVLWRLAQGLPTLFLVSLLSFWLLAAAPVDPARMALSAGASLVNLDDRDILAKRVELGLDRSLPERYVRWWADVLRLDLGRSFGNGQPVAQLFRERLAASATLTILALVVSVGIGLPLGGLAAVRAGRWPDTLGRVVALLGASVPGFWLALLLMWLFAARLHWVPALGSFTPAGIVLPTLVLAARPMGRLTRLMRATTMDALTLDCMTVAHAKGLPAHVVLRRHVLPNALLPVITVVALDAAALLANSVVVEWVFAWPGVGRLGADAALTGDAPVLMAFVLLVGAVVVALNGAADLLHGLVDPRQRPGAVV